MFSTGPYTYLIGINILLIIWLVFFVIRKDLRKEMLVASLLTAPLGLIGSYFFMANYWRPEVPYPWFFDALYSFMAGGLASVIYSIILNKKYIAGHKRASMIWIIATALSGLALFFIITLGFKLNPIYASFIGFLIIGGINIYFRPDLLLCAIGSGVLFMMLTLISYLVFISLFPDVIQKWWMLENLSGILLLNIPFEELLWAFGWGFLAGPFYKLLVGAGLTHKNQ